MVDLRDLAARYAWNPLAITRFIEAAGLIPTRETTASFAPPRVVIAIVPIDNAAMLARSRAWLRDAAQVIVVRARQGSVAEGDALLQEVVEADWRDALKCFAAPVEVMDWRRDEDLGGIIARAVTLAEGAGLSRVSVA